MISVITRWIFAYWMFSAKKEKPLHVLFCLVDHFEPGADGATAQVENERMSELLAKYPKISEKHKDFYGNMPKRTWFFPPHYHRNYNLKKLVLLCEKGYGEIELHLHHGKTQPDTSDNLKQTILQCLKEYGEFGIFGLQNGERKYAFIHGDWALDNSMNGKFCGVNDEIGILSETGCYADFTFPSLYESNPKQINSIYYAVDNPDKPKSYNKGKQVIKGGRKSGDLMIIQGPLHPFFFSNKLTRLRTPGDAINGSPPVTNKRVDFWVKTGIHIKGKNDCIIIKTHTHGATDSNAVLGEEIDDIFNYLETKYNDGKHYILHYVTARELYNIIKAIEAGEASEKSVSPNEYRDYLINKPSYNSSIDVSGASNILKNLISKTYKE
ncbi:MAG: hypothetical protein MIO92_14640 [Methanosarcinaceae archaeon]|nr:hypothetical protein [Methanosarcinaceae archaeon]